MLTNTEFILAAIHSGWFAKANLEHYASENGKKIRFVSAVPEKIARLSIKISLLVFMFHLP